MIKYKKVYFRINTPSYYKAKYGVGFENQEASTLFKTIAENIFLNDGWEIKEKKYTIGCTTLIKDKQELYLHPQSFSGVVREDNILYIENLLSNNNMFRFERTDIYDEVFDMSDEDYINKLKEHQEEIEREILDKFKTKRRNLYVSSTWTPLNTILSKYKIKRLTQYMGAITSDDIDIKWIDKVFEKLISEKKIVTAKVRNGTGYRTATIKDGA